MSFPITLYPRTLVLKHAPTVVMAYGTYTMSRLQLQYQAWPLQSTINMYYQLLDATNLSKRKRDTSLAMTPTRGKPITWDALCQGLPRRQADWL